jgi:hypothetical protein
MNSKIMSNQRILSEVEEIMQIAEEIERLSRPLPPIKNNK